MIYYLVTRAHAYTLAAFVQGWGKALAGRILVAPCDATLFVLPGIQDGRDAVHRLAAQGIVAALLALEGSA